MDPNIEYCEKMSKTAGVFDMKIVFATSIIFIKSLKIGRFQNNPIYSPCKDILISPLPQLDPPSCREINGQIRSVATIRHEKVLKSMSKQYKIRYKQSSNLKKHKHEDNSHNTNERTNDTNTNKKDIFQRKSAHTMCQDSAVNKDVFC